MNEIRVVNVANKIMYQVPFTCKKCGITEIRECFLRCKRSTKTLCYDCRKLQRREYARNRDNKLSTLTHLKSTA